MSFFIDRKLMKKERQEQIEKLIEFNNKLKFIILKIFDIDIFEENKKELYLEKDLLNDKLILVINEAYNFRMQKINLNTFDVQKNKFLVINIFFNKQRIKVEFDVSNYSYKTISEKFETINEIYNILKNYEDIKKDLNNNKKRLTLNKI